MDEPKPEISPDELARVQYALDTMRPKYRDPFCLLRFDALTYPEIADRLGITTQEVERRIARALLHLMRTRRGGNRRWWRLW
jgi:RNA polymerase sigma factor (sigma-70 family)